MQQSLLTRPFDRFVQEGDLSAVDEDSWHEGVGDISTEWPTALVVSVYAVARAFVV